MGKPAEIKKQSTLSLKLTKFELLHLRDLFNVRLPHELKQTVSQALAQAEDRDMVETTLWHKVSGACREAGLPLDDEAPDYVCAASAPPPVSVFRLAHEPSEGQERPIAKGNPFGEDEVEETTSTDVASPTKRRPRKKQK
jgi:hypothetical protein